ncbi:ROK family protein [Companilactobacillus mishanensis]|uniref:ROK family protein n=1 Tax=Companilactobacillus mishanensis TaxID=2486008 RepID=A0ABW9P862_9LACO|nr:ROK family protein [Companilactobacillus mishanensis]MQS45465.1 ROK family protein [Companilactobacillus mishanensis]
MSKQFLAFDVGGTTIKYGLVDENLNISDTGKVDTKHNENGFILKQLTAITEKFQKDNYIDGVGVSTAGIVGSDGAILYAGPTIPGYQGTAIKEELENKFKLPVFVVNDVDAALLGEKIAGVAKNVDSAYCVALGTGIGGSYLNHGILNSGSHAFANSVGYILYDEKSDTYYEQRASTLTLEKNLKPYNVSVIDAFDMAKGGMETYRNIIEDWAHEVAAGLANIVLLYDPEVLVIGGAVSQQGDFLIDMLHKHMSKMIPEGLFKTSLAIAKLTDKAQLLGAISQFV